MPPEDPLGKGSPSFPDSPVSEDRPRIDRDREARRRARGFGRHSAPPWWGILGIAATLLLVVAGPTPASHPSARSAPQGLPEELARPAIASPTLSTLLSAVSVPAGHSVYDTATFSGFQSGTVGGGSLTYYLFTGSGVCSSSGGAPITVSVVTVGFSGSVPNSAPHTFNTPGPDSWQASYAGNANNNPVNSPCESMNVTKANTTLTTTLVPGTIVAGSSAYDTASLAGNTSTASGTVTYEFFPSGTCSGTPTPVDTGTVSGGVVPKSTSQKFGTAGGYGWEASYSGDANNSATISACEFLNVTSNQTNPTLTTTLSANPITAGQTDSDSATLAGATGGATGTIAFHLYAIATCLGPYTLVSTDPVAGPGTYASSSQPFPTAGSSSWEALYSGDSQNNPAKSPCEPLTVNKATPTLTTKLSVVANLTGNFVIPTIPTDVEPCDMAFDSANGYVYATLFGSSSVQIINAATNATVATVAVGTGPCGITYDSNNHDVYVADSYFGRGPSSVSVISGTSVVATVATGISPWDVAFDPNNDEVYVGGQGSTTVPIICDGGAPCGGSPQTNKIVASVPLGASHYPSVGGIVYDPQDGDLYLSYGTDVAVISGASVIASIHLPALLASYQAAFDPNNGYLYFPDGIDVPGRVVVVNGHTNAYVATVAMVNSNGGTAGNVVFDSASGTILASAPFGDLNVISGTTVVNHVPYSGDSITYASTNAEIFLGYYRPPTSYVRVFSMDFTVTDSAQLSGETSGAGGTVTYQYFVGTTCSGAPILVSSASVVGGLAGDSLPRSFPSSTYSYDALYGGDANNNPATSACEPFFPTVAIGSPIRQVSQVVVFALLCPANLLVSDPSGRRAGVEANGTVLNETPGATVMGPDRQAEVVSILNDSWGLYVITVVGTSSASSTGSNFTLSAAATSVNVSANSNQSTVVTDQGTITPGEVEIFDVTISPSSGSIRLVSTSGGTGSNGGPRFLGLPGDDGYLVVAAIVAAVVLGGGFLVYARRTRRPPTQDPENRAS